jgi:hypothetical protein
MPLDALDWQPEERADESVYRGAERRTFDLILKVLQRDDPLRHAYVRLRWQARYSRRSAMQTPCH